MNKECLGKICFLVIRFFRRISYLISIHLNVLIYKKKVNGSTPILQSFGEDEEN